MGVRSRASAVTTTGAALLLLAACGSGSSTSVGQPSRTPAHAPALVSPAPAPATSSKAPLDYRAAVTVRLADEFGSEAVARQVVQRVGPAALMKLKSRVPLSSVATSPLLAYRAPRIPAGTVDSVVAFSFGYEVTANGGSIAGPPNHALATSIATFVRSHPVPVFAQTEIAQILKADGVSDVTSIDAQIGRDGKQQYLSTAGVAAEVVSRAKSARVSLGTVGVFGFADHAGRCILTAEAAGMTGGVPVGVTLPDTYDPKSAQPWTRTRVTYLSTDLLSRIAS